MIENIVVVLIVGASAWYAGVRYLPAKWIRRAKADGCGTGGCDTCNACAEPAPPTGQRVIKINPIS